MTSDSQQPAAASSTPRHRARRRPSMIRRVLTWLLLVVLAVAGLRILFEVCLWRTQVALEDRRHVAADRWIGAAGWLGFVAPEDATQAERILLQARTDRRLGRFTQLSEQLERVLELGGDLRAVEREQWLALAQTGQFDRVGAHLADLFREAGSDGPEICSAYVALLLSKFRTAEAIRILDIWEADYPNDPEAPFQRGRVQFVLQNWADSLDGLSRCLELNEDHLEARLMRAQARTKLVQFAEAERDLAIVLAAQPENLTALVERATCLSSLNKAEQAQQLLESVLELDRDNAAALSQLGRLHLKLEDPEAALPLLERAAELRPEDTDTRYALARTLQTQGHKAEAEPHFQFVTEATRELLKLSPLVEKLVASPEDVELRFRVAMITWKWKSRRDGEQWLRSVLDYDPGHMPTHSALAEHYNSIGETEKAEFHRARGLPDDAP